MSESIFDTLIVGAGVSGLYAARELKRRGKTVQVVDKARGVGGRLATRRWGQARFDHGAQYFTVKSESFAREVAATETRIWCDGFPDGQGRLPPDFRTDRYCGVKGMTDLAKSWARDLSVSLNFKVLRLNFSAGLWEVVAEDGATKISKSLLLTCPVPQSLALIDPSEIKLEDADRLKLESLTYDPCFAVMAKLDGAGNIPNPGALRIGGERLVWIADNYQKGISPEPGAITLLASANYSARVFEEDPNEVAKTLIADAAPSLGSAVREWQLHRWRYSQPQLTLTSPLVAHGIFPPLVFCGDAFSEGRVESAALSGGAAAALIF